MDCRELEKVLSDHSLAELSLEQQEAVAAHVDGCDACREKWGLDQQSRVLHTAAKALRPSKDIAASVMARIDQEAPPADKAESEANGPKRLGGFELLGRLGKGGMGTVLKARQVSMDRLVALKILPKKLAENEQFVQRFLREARSAARLRHPHIVQAHDVGRVEGYYFFAMEYVDGKTLEAIVREEGPLEQGRALAVMKQVCSALAAAHKAGIVHRDIKPSNIMVDRDGEARVTDFGLAKRTEGDVAVTADGHVLGTPAYVAPEMTKGEEAEPRSDLYSLGATIFHALAGRPPFEGRNFSEVLVRQATELPPPLVSLAPHVDRRLCYIIDRLLRKNPEARPSSAAALLDDLEGLGALQAVKTPVGAPQAVDGAGRAEARAMIREAPTLEMTEAQRLEREAAVRAHVRHGRAQGQRTPLVVLGAIVALLAVIGLIVAITGPQETTRSVPDRDDKQGVDTRKGTVTFDDSAAQRARAEKALEAAIAALRSQCDTLVAKDQFGKAIEQADAFAEEHAADRGAGEAASLKDEILETAEARYAEVAGAADAAIKAKDSAKARNALEPVASFGIAELAEKARTKLAEIDSREKEAALWTKWDGAKARAAWLAATGKFDEAIAALQGMRGLALDGIADRIADEVDSIEDARRKAREAALAAYARESDKVWGFFRERKYPAAGKLLVTLAVRPEFKAAAEHLHADLQATGHLKVFWAAVERGIATRRGSVSIRGAVGNINAVDKGVITIRTVRGESVTRSVYDLDAKQALGYAARALKDDESSRLAEAVFRIAENEDPVRAETLLAAAGDPPGLEFYRDRLAALTLGAAELAAREAWRTIKAQGQAKLTEKRAGQLLASIAAFETAHGKTKTGQAVQGDLAALRTRALEVSIPWTPLFDGKTLEGWRIVEEASFEQHGRVGVEAGTIVLGQGPKATGIARVGDFPRVDYEVKLEAMLEAGDDTLCNVFFPVGRQECVFSIGGWGLSVTGLTALDGRGADDNETGRRMRIVPQRWYRVQLRVTEAKVQAWIDDEMTVDLVTVGRTLGEPNHGPLRPFGLCNWRTRCRLRNVRMRRVKSEATPPVPAGEWVSLFDGESLEGWAAVKDFPGRGAGGTARVEDGCIALQSGVEFAGVVLQRQFPDTDYEIELEAQRVVGNGDLLAITFPIGAARCSFVVGGSENRMTGLQVIDGRLLGFGPDGARRHSCQNGRWYRIGLRVTSGRIQAWVDGEQVVDFAAAGRRLSVYPTWRGLRPLGLTASKGTARLRSIRFRRIEP
jgi:serine/threonine-protein kinase